MCGPAEAEAFGRFCDWLDRALRARDAELHRAELRLAARPGSPARPGPRAGAPRRVPQAGHGRRPLLRRRAPAAHLQLPVDVRRAWRRTRRWPSTRVITYMDTVNGVFVPEGGMHALPVALAAAAEKAGATFRYDTPVDRILLAEGTSRAGARACASADGEVVAADAVVANPDLPVAYRTLLPGTADAAPARRGRYSPSAVVWHVGVRGELPAGTEHHNIHFGGEWDGAFRAHPARRRPHARPVAAGQRAVARRTDDGARRSATSLYVLEPAPNLDGRVDWTTRARPGARRPRSATSTASATRPTSRSRSSSTPSTGRRRAWSAGTPFALSHTFRQTGPFRPGNLEAPSARPGVRRLRHRARRRRADGARVRDAGRRSGSRRWSRGDDAPPWTRATRAAGELNKRYGTTYYWSTFVLPRVKRHHVWALYAFCRHADDIVDDLGPAVVRRAGEGAGRLRRPVLRRPRRGALRRPGAQGRRAHGARLRHRPGAASAASSARWRWTSRSPTYATWDDLLGYMDGSAAVIGEMMLPILEPLAPERPRPGPRPRATPSSSRTSCATSPRTSTAAGCTSRRRTSTASAPTRRAASSTSRGASSCASRSSAAARSTGPPTAVSTCSRPARLGASARPGRCTREILDRIEAADYDVFTSAGHRPHLAQGRPGRPGCCCQRGG